VYGARVTKFCLHDIFEACRDLAMIFDAKGTRSKLQGHKMSVIVCLSYTYDATTLSVFAR